MNDNGLEEIEQTAAELKAQVEKLEHDIDPGGAWIMEKADEVTTHPVADEVEFTVEATMPFTDLSIESQQELAYHTKRQAIAALSQAKIDLLIAKHVLKTAESKLVLSGTVEGKNQQERDAFVRNALIRDTEKLLSAEIEYERKSCAMLLAEQNDQYWRDSLLLHGITDQSGYADEDDDLDPLPY